MDRRVKVVHLRTGDAAIDGRIAAWLRRHGATVIECADACEACVLAVRAEGLPPQLAMVGADWLAPDEFSVLGYFREVWPSIGIVITGSPRVVAMFPASPRTYICRNEAALVRMFALTPAALYDQIASGARRPLEGPAGAVAGEDGYRPVAPGVSRILDHARASSDPDERPTGREPQTGDGVAAAADPLVEPDSTEITGRPLTPEEVAALLDDDAR